MVFYKDSGKWFPLHSALIFGDLAAAKDLFERGTNAREMLVKSNGKGWRALHFACHSGHNDSVSVALSVVHVQPHT